MSFHIVHIFEHGGSLYKERGRLYFKTPEGMKSLPIANVRAIIIAAKGISISSQLISALLEVDCLLLHCDRRYQPIGWTLPATRTMHQGILEGQMSPRGRFRESLWNEVLRQKITNQRDVLGYLGIAPNPLDRFLTGRLDEGAAARVYFGHFFQKLEAIGQNRAQKHRGWLNALLNYGYAVLTSMVHRSIIVHGMMSNLGIHHKARYRSYPLVYDLMEPLRPLVDGLVVNWLKEWREIADNQTPEDGLHAFAKFIGMALREFRVSHDRYSLKMIDSIDLYTRGVAKSFQSLLTEGIWMPSIDIARLAAYDGKSKN